jgi:hypothetical protein
MNPSDAGTPDDEAAFDEAAFASAAGEPGHPGSPQHANEAMERQFANNRRGGTMADAAKSWANTAALGAGPQIAGVMGAIANAAVNPGTSDAEAYRSVRDDSAKDIALSEETGAGQAIKPLAMLSTPIPVKSLGPEAGMGAKMGQGAKVGGVAGAIHGAATSKGDLTNMSTADLKRVALDALFQGGEGYLGGGLVGGAMGAGEVPLRSASRRLPMDMLGVGEAARRSMQKQGIYDQAGDDLLSLVRPLGGASNMEHPFDFGKLSAPSGMRKGSLTQDALAELQRRGVTLDDSISAVDTKAGGQSVSPDSMAVSVLRGSKPYSSGSLHDKQVSGRMGDEADNLLESLGNQPVSLAKAEEFKQRFGPGVAKLLKHAGEPAAKTTALGETYRALKTANEAGAANVDPALAAKFIEAKKSYQRLAAPLEGANVERAGLRGSDFEWGDALNQPETPLMSKLAEAGIPKWMSGAVVTPLNIAGRAYGRGAAANAAEFLANRMSKNTGGVVGAAGARGLADWSRFLKHDEEK